jgi:hypothetical protein
MSTSLIQCDRKLSQLDRRSVFNVGGEATLMSLPHKGFQRFAQIMTCLNNSRKTSALNTRYLARWINCGNKFFLY